ncbi:MAG: CHAT domain-containing protein, partial [Acidobacteriota bacterium]
VLRNGLVALNTQLFRESQQPQPDQMQLNNLQSKLEKARLAYEAFRVDLYTAHPELKEQRGEAHTITLAETAILLPDTKTALLEFMLTEDKCYLFVITKHNHKMENCCSSNILLNVYSIDIKQQELVHHITNFHNMIANKQPHFVPLSRQLYDLVIKPAEEPLTGKTTLVIVPDGILWELPFQALRSDKHRYLLDHYAITYAPSLTALREMLKLNNRLYKGKPTLLAFGNPALDLESKENSRLALLGEKLTPLPETETLVKKLARLYGANHSKIYVGVNALEQNVKAEASHYRIVQFATHGIFDNQNPMYSRIIMSQINNAVNEDGLLEAWELMNLDFQVDMVVLSACETARGRIGEGEGIIGLSWALFVAGCPTTVVSQWKAEVSSTCELMIEFHRRLQTKLRPGNNFLAKAEALRQAALKLRNNIHYRHPFYWTSFIIVGNGW